MKNSGSRVIFILLVLIEVGLGIKSFMILQPLLLKNGKPVVSDIDLIVLISFIVLTMIISIAFSVLVFQKPRRMQVIDSEIQSKSDVKDKKEQKLLMEEEKKRIKEQNERKKAIVEELSKDLNLINDLQRFAEKVLINISKHYSIMQGLFYLKNQQDKVYRKIGTYAYYSEEELREFTEDVGLSGQVAVSKKLLNISNIPDKYLTVVSGLGKSSPANLLIFPVLSNNESIGIVELASFVKFDTFAEEVLMEFSGVLGKRMSDLLVEKPQTI